MDIQELKTILSDLSVENADLKNNHELLSNDIVTLKTTAKQLSVDVEKLSLIGNKNESNIIDYLNKSTKLLEVRVSTVLSEVDKLNQVIENTYKNSSTSLKSINHNGDELIDKVSKISDKTYNEIDIFTDRFNEMLDTLSTRIEIEFNKKLDEHQKFYDEQLERNTEIASFSGLIMTSIFTIGGFFCGFFLAKFLGVT